MSTVDRELLEAIVGLLICWVILGLCIGCVYNQIKKDFGRRD
jgi:hypothetical protein